MENETRTTIPVLLYTHRGCFESVCIKQEQVTQIGRGVFADKKFTI
jgi:hypothetical protein